MMNLYQLTTFVNVISEGSMTAAADKLFLTQPAVSQQIRNLEEDMGVELLVRGVRQIKATPQGEVLYEYARKILHLSQQAEVAIKNIGAELKGKVRIGTLNSLGLHLMSPIVSRLLRHNPDLFVKVEYGKGDDLIKSYNKGELDILILPDLTSQFGSDIESGTESKFLNKEEMWLVGSGKEVELLQQASLEQITKLPLVHFIDEYPGFHKKLEDSLSAKNIKPNVIFESSNVGTLKRVIENGLGWGFLPAHSIKKQVRSGRLIRVHMKDFSYEMDLMFYYRTNSDKKVLSEAMFQALSQQEKN